MSFAPFMTAPLEIQIHASAATLAVVTGPVALFRRRRDQMHKIIGYVWSLSMLTVAVTAFFIHSFAVIGPFSPLHGFAILTLWSLWMAMRHIYAGRVDLHAAVLRNLYFTGLLLAGLANFLPGRRANLALFGDQPELGWIFIVIGAVMIVCYLSRQVLLWPLLARLRGVLPLGKQHDLF